MIGYQTVPYVIAYANEEVTTPIGFEPFAGALRLAYQGPRMDDWVNGVLRARVLDLRSIPDKRGPERMRWLNTRRQWRCMDRLWCQVCGRPAVDVHTRRLPWLITKTVFDQTGTDSGLTSTPPTCRDCVDEARQQCPMLQQDCALYSVGSVRSAGALADLYQPGPEGTLTLTHHNVFLSWQMTEYHRRALATCQVVQLGDMQLEP